MCGSNPIRGALVAVALAASLAAADEVPLQLQVQLLSKMSTLIDLPPGVSSTIKVLVIYPGTFHTPSRGAQTLASAIEQVGQFGSLKAEAKLARFVDTKKFEAALAAEKPQFIYLAPELKEQAVRDLVEASATSEAITISSVGDYVKLGVVLGFSLEEAKPRVLLNLKQVRKQHIVLHSGLTRHAVIVER